MYIIAVAIQKGGTAKTTTTLCLGGALTLLGYKVLLIDMDPQANTTSSLAIEPTILESPTVLELLTDPEVTLETAIVKTDYGMDLIPSTISLALAERELMAATNSKKLYRKLVEHDRASQIRPEIAYDYVLIDCPPSLGVLTINALSAANGVIAPVNCEHYAEKGLNDFLKTMREIQLEVNESLEMLGVLLTMYTPIKTHKDVATYLRKTLPGKVFTTMISKRAVLTEVPVKGPVQSYAPNSESSDEYNKLGLEVQKNVKA